MSTYLQDGWMALKLAADFEPYRLDAAGEGTMKYLTKVALVQPQAM